MHRTSRLLLSLAALSSPLVAQLEIATSFGVPPYTNLGGAIAGIGDGNGDGRADFVVYSLLPGTPIMGRVQLISGATLAVAGQAQGVGNFGLEILAGAGDMDLDTNDDFLAGAGQLRAFSGSSAAPLWTSGVVGTFLEAASIDDLDNDGRADVAAVATIGNDEYLLTLRGSDGSQISSLGPLNDYPRAIVSLGDVNGDGHDEVAVMANAITRIYRTSPLQFLRNVTTPTSSYRFLAAANVDGDARKEVLLSRSGSLYVCSAATGQTLRTYPINENEFTPMADLDGDGYDDIASRDLDTRYGYTADPSLVFLSGATGALLSSWSRTPQFRARQLAGIGDVDGDGVGDLLLGDEYASAIPSTSGGGWQLVSGRILANTYRIPVQCTGGPFPPDLGMTRPLIGQSVTFVGRDCPPNAWGTLAMSLPPAFPISLGFPGCNAWWNIGSWVIVHQPAPAATWTYSLPLPNAPQLAGVNLALQSFYVPTGSPIGFDLSNAIWTRIGF